VGASSTRANAMYPTVAIVYDVIEVVTSVGCNSNGPLMSEFLSLLWALAATAHVPLAPQ
jgi:hypothetical protein